VVVARERYVTPRRDARIRCWEGGAVPYGIPSVRPNSEVPSNQGWGVLKLTLRGGGYDWEFMPVSGHSFRDAGSASCGL
jgi:hypothetical protein